MRRLGLTPSTEVLDVERGVPPAATVEALGLRPGEQAIRVRRLRLADGAPMSVDDAWYSAALAPDLDTAPLTGSVYELLRDRYGVAIDHAEQTVAATEAGDEYGALLGLDPTRPVLLFDRVSFARRPARRALLLALPRRPLRDRHGGRRQVAAVPMHRRARR